MQVRERHLSPSAGPGKSDGRAVRPTTPPDFDEASFGVALFNMADKMARDEQRPTEQELQAQGDATISRVREFFTGVDITTPAPKEHPRYGKSGGVDIVVFDFPFGGTRIARASVNGFELAEIRTYDQTIGMLPYYQNYPKDRPEVAYELHGLVGSDHTAVDAYITSYKDGMRILTDLDYYNSTRRMSVLHKVGKTPLSIPPWNEKDHPIPFLHRQGEVSVLRQLGVTLQPTK
jgi:hypothetical protein